MKVAHSRYTAWFLASGLFLAGQALADTLPSWNKGELKQALVEFVTASSQEGGAGYIDPAERIAVFDMDGTLVAEVPLPIAVVPIIDTLRSAVEADPQALGRPGVQAFLDGDAEELSRLGDAAIANVISVAYAGRTVEEVTRNVRPVLTETMHPTLERPLAELQYQPMLELLDLLRDHGFQVWISSGTPVGISREISREMFGIPPENVMGSMLDTEFRQVDGRWQLVVGDGVAFVNDMETKPVAIYRSLGQRPAFVGGNVGNRGDIAMMRYSMDREGPSFQLLVNHDDEEREFAYAESDNYSLNAAEEHGFHVVSMKQDWNTIWMPTTE